MARTDWRLSLASCWLGVLVLLLSCTAALHAPGPTATKCVPPAVVRAVMAENRSLREQVRVLQAPRREPRGLCKEDGRPATMELEERGTGAVASAKELNATTVAAPEEQGGRVKPDGVSAEVVDAVRAAVLRQADRRNWTDHRLEKFSSKVLGTSVVDGVCGLRGFKCNLAGEVTSVVFMSRYLDITDALLKTVCRLPSLASVTFQRRGNPVRRMDLGSCSELQRVDIANLAEGAVVRLPPGKPLSRLRIRAGADRVDVNWGEAGVIMRAEIIIRGASLPGLENAKITKLLVTRWDRKSVAILHKVPRVAKVVKVTNVVPGWDWGSVPALRSLHIHCKQNFDVAELEKMLGGIGSSKIRSLSASLNMRGPAGSVLDFPEPVKNLTQLTKLEWDGDGQQAWAPDLTSFKALKTVHLRNLGISNTPMGMDQLPSLREADLSHNNLTDISPAVLRLPELNTITLDHNRMSQMGPGLRAAAAMPKLRVFLEGNPVEGEFVEATGARSAERYAGVYELIDELKTMLEGFDLTVQPDEICGRKTEGIVDCNAKGEVVGIRLEEMGLRTVPRALLRLAPDLISLSLDGNVLTELPTELMDRLAIVQTFIAASNRLTEIPTFKSRDVQHIDMSRNQITVIPADISRTQPSLKVLMLSDNKIKVIPSLPSWLAHLALNNNQVTTIPLDFSKYGLEYLYLRHNNLTAEALDGFTLHEAKAIDFSHNPLITRFPNVDIRHLGQTLDFSDCSIAEIDPEAYTVNMGPVMYSRMLRLRGNRLTSVPSAVFETPGAHTIDLSRNLIERISENDFIATEAGVLDLSFNRIEEVTQFDGSHLGMTGKNAGDPADLRLALSQLPKKHGPLEPFNILLSFNQIRSVSSQFAFVMDQVSADLVDLNGNPLDDWGTTEVCKKCTTTISDLSLPAVLPKVTSDEDDRLILALRKADTVHAVMRDFPFFKDKIRTLAGAGPDAIVHFTHYDDGTLTRFNLKVPFQECGLWLFQCNTVNIAIATCWCDTGFYRESARVCRQCPVGGHCDFDLVKCADTMFTKALDAPPPSQYAADMKCELCPAGAVCDGVAVTPTPGYWRPSVESQEVLACSNPEACSGGEESECAEGYSGILCGQCTRGYYAVAAHTCLECPKPIVSIVFFTVSCIGVAAASISFFVMAGKMLQERQSKEEKRSQRMATLTGMMSNTQSVSTISHSLKHAIGFLQLITSLDVTFDVKWPIAMDFLDDVFSWVNLDILKSTSLECVWELTSLDDGNEQSLDSTVSSGFGYGQRVMLTGLIPISVSLTLLVVYWLYYGVYRLAEWMPVLRAVTRYDVGSLKRLCIQCHLLLWQLCYLPVSYLAIQYFHCRSLDGGATYYIHNDLETRCYDGAYWVFSGPAIAIIVVYTVGMPVAIAWYGLAKRRFVHDERVVGSLAILYRNYKKEYVYWEAVEMARKVLVGGAVVLLAGSSTFQLTVALVVMYLFTVMHSRCWPNMSDMANTIQVLLLCLTFLTMGLGLLRTLEVPGGQSSVFSAVVIGTDILVVAGILAMLMYEMSTIIREKVSKASHRVRHAYVKRIRGR